MDVADNGTLLFRPRTGTLPPFVATLVDVSGLRDLRALRSGAHRRGAERRGDGAEAGSAICFFSRLLRKMGLSVTIRS